MASGGGKHYILLDNADASHRPGEFRGRLTCFALYDDDADNKVVRLQGRSTIGEVKMALSVKQMMEAANAVVPKITPAQAREMIAKGNAFLVDVRDGLEVQSSGKVAGAVHVSRGMLEFRADPDSPAHDKHFAKDKTVILYCGSGGRAALAGKLLKDMGYGEVYNAGSFKDWADSGGAVES
jgi:rhodanese-related sulfurtransferase